MAHLERIVYFINRWLNWAAGSVLVLAVLLICVNVIFRAFGKPILGVFEIVGFGGAVVASCALGYTQLKRGHIGVEVVVSRLSQRSQTIIESIASFLSMGLFTILTWQCVLLANSSWQSGELSETLRFPYFILIYVLAFGSAALCLVCLVDFLKSLSKALGK